MSMYKTSNPSSLSHSLQVFADRPPPVRPHHLRDGEARHLRRRRDPRQLQHGHGARSRVVQGIALALPYDKLN